MRKTAAENIRLENRVIDTPGNVFKFEWRKPM